MGKFMPDGLEVLLKYDATAAVWQRLATEEPLVAGQQLLALPAYRPRIELTSAVTVDLLGGTRVTLLAAGPEGPAGVEVSYGRVVVKPLAQPRGRLRLVVGGCKGVLTLVEPESIAAVEVNHAHSPGVNPETESSKITCDLYVSQGAVVWDEGLGKNPVEISSPARLSLLPPAKGPATIGGASVPKWIAFEPIGPLDQRAAAVIAQSLQSNRSARLGLLELADHRQREVRWLATRCLGYLGHFDPMVAALDDMSRRIEWLDCVDQLRLAVARSPETAAAVRQAIEKQFSDESAELYRMLWGYSDKDLSGGEDLKLVNYLEHERLAFRFLAFWNLKDVTGLGLFYRPELPAAKRSQSTKHWKSRQQSGRSASAQRRRSRRTRSKRRRSRPTGRRSSLARNRRLPLRANRRPTRRRRSGLGGVLPTCPLARIPLVRGV